MAELTNNLKLLQHVQVFYDNGLNQMRDEIGWSPENTQQTTNDQTDHGEMNNSGDILETALILGQFGYDQYYNDAERIIRAHTLPSQLRDTSFIIEPDNPDNLDGLKNMGQRQQGAWGFPAPYGHKSINYGRGAISFNLDIVGGTTASLCQAYGHIARQDNTGIHLNLLFDYQDENIQIKSPYTNSALQIKALKPIPLYVRIPQWVDPQALKVSASQSPHFQTGSHLFFPAAAAYENITISFPLTLQTITMTKNHIHPIRVKLQGDQVLAMDNFGADFTFFDPIPD